jgi:hypothetical protein
MFDFALPTSGIWKSIEVELNSSLLHYIRFILGISSEVSHKDPKKHISAHIVLKTSCGNSVCLTDRKGNNEKGELNSLMLGPLQHIVNNVAHPKTDKGNTLSVFGNVFGSEEQDKQNTREKFKKLGNFIKEVSKKRNPNTHEKIMTENEFSEFIEFIFENDAFSFYDLMVLKQKLKSHITKN